MNRRRRFIGAVGAVLSIALAGTLVTADQAMSQTVESFRDTFRVISFSGNDGTQNWSGSWQESGENDGPTSGALRVTSSDRCSGSCLRIGSDGGSIEGRGVHRVANLTDAVSATLSLRYRRETQGQTTGSVAVQVSRNGGASWNTLQTISLAGAKNSATVTFDISAYIASSTAVRFVGSGSLVTGYLHIDDVEVSADIIVPPTTTTTAASPSTTTTVSPTTTTAPSGSTTTTTFVSDSTSTTTSIVGATTTTPTAVGGSTATSSPSTTTTDGHETTTTGSNGESVVTMSSEIEPSPVRVPSDEALSTTSQPAVPEASTPIGGRVGLISVATEALGVNAVSAGLLVVLVSGLTLAGVERRRDHASTDE